MNIIVHSQCHELRLMPSHKFYNIRKCLLVNIYCGLRTLDNSGAGCILLFGKQEVEQSWPQLLNFRIGNQNGGQCNQTSLLVSDSIREWGDANAVSVQWNIVGLKEEKECRGGQH